MTTHEYEKHTIYNPDSWVVLKVPQNLVIQDSKEVIYKVLGGFAGGYLYSDAWRMNSGITEVCFEDGYYNFYGYTGSCYVCHPESYGLRMSTCGIYNSLREMHGDSIELLDKNTDWLRMVLN